MRFFRNILDHILVMVDIRFWIMTSEYSPKWDKELIQLMEKFKFNTHGKVGKDDTVYEVTLNNKIIWATNYPYGAFTIKLKYNKSYSVKDPFGEVIRPSRVTILRAKRKMEKDTQSIENRRDYILRKIGVK